MPDLQLRIELSLQRLSCIEAGRVTDSFPVSTAKNGAGEQCDSGCTPRGRHRIRLKIGERCEENTVFVGRRATGERYSRELAEKEPGRDWVLTRILWLTGLEQGKNRGGRVDSLRRFIYIHGTPDEEPMGVPASHGCIRMRNRDLMALFDRVERGTLVEIVA
ncbi:MAG: L,D-transpeptidase [Candidatus Thiodiazotropha sp. (ex Dulcina madagascariensis)]|nr:L,D-transpeptidase [Candidatus Thiodiazotropha sp. (ex Dulcina madagascariensis)]